MRPVLIAAMAAALLGPSVSQAQQTPSPATKTDDTAVSGVTVTAPRDLELKKKTFPSVVETFVESHEVDGPHGALTRWMTGLCPAVEGLSPDFNAFVYHRLLEVADEVGVPKPRPGDCKHSNVLVVFTTAADRFMIDIREHHPLLLGYHFPSDTKKLAAFEPPLKAWRITATNGLIDNPEIPAHGGPASHNDSGLNSEFVFALVVVDPSTLADQPIGRIADDIAEQVVSNPGARHGCASLPSILDSLDPACPASSALETLSDYDKALLKGLYHSNPETRVQYQRSTMRQQILQETRPPAGDGGG